MKKGNARNKTLLTFGLVTLLIGAAVSAQASGVVPAHGQESSFALIPLLSSIAFAFARKRA